MSGGSCEVAHSSTSSGGDFQCTEDELFESFMEIVNNPELHCSDVALEKTSICSDDGKSSENADKSIDIEEKDPVGNASQDNGSGSIEEAQILNQDSYGVKDYVETADKVFAGKDPVVSGNGHTCEDVVIDQDNMSDQKDTSSSQNEASQGSDMDQNEHVLVREKNIKNKPEIEGVHQCNSNDSSVLIQEEDGLVDCSEGEAAIQDQGGLNEKDVNKLVQDQESSNVKNSNSGKDTDGSVKSNKVINENNERTNATSNGFYETDVMKNSNELSDSATAECANTDAPKPEQKEDATGMNTLELIEHSIEEGIKKAHKVCDEINEFMKRISQSSDEILNDNAESQLVPSTLEKVESGCQNSKANVVPESLVSEVVTPREGINEGASSNMMDINKGENKHDPPVPRVAVSCHGDDSSSTSSSHLEEFHNSDDSAERKKSTSDSLASSEGSISSDSKGSCTSPGNGKATINWEILNTAFENPETDEEESDVYESSGTYGGFGLVLDDDSVSRLSVDDERIRTVSQSSTVSESEFRAAYSRQHSSDSLDKKHLRDGILCSGYLLKLGGTGITPKNWRKRWCVLRRDRCLYYYKTARDNVPCGIVVLTNYIVSRSSEFHKKNCMKLSRGGGRTYFFSSETHMDMLRWIEVLREAAEVPSEGANFVIRDEIIHNVAIPALSIKKPDCHGYLTKQGGKNRNSWKRRYCVLKNGCLYYYREMADTTALGVAKLHGYKVEEVTASGKRNGFRAVPPQSGMRTFTFVADNEYDKKRWIPCFEHSIQSNASS